MELTLGWKRFLRCPECYGQLASSESSWNCSQCHCRYDQTPSGIPILMRPQDLSLIEATLARDEASAMKGEYERRAGSAKLQKLVRKLYPPEPVYVNPAAPALPQPQGELSLWLGGAGLQLPGFVNVDLVPAKGVDLLATASRLPFQDDCGDSIACLALLEHVPDPAQVVSEIHRVLKTGGEVQVVVPFCHPYHAYPADYTRFSREGLEKLFTGYQDVRIGIRTGPTTTILTFLTYYSKLLFPVHGGNPVLRGFNRLVAGAFGWAMYPFKYLDVWLNRLPQASVLANHFYLTAKK
jgi:SAM-dependent methyltransferase